MVGIGENGMSGKAFLIGAGPGRADLITVRGLNLLRQAEVVIYDRLIARELLSEIPAASERIYVGKKTGLHTISQEAITQLIVDHVKAGKQVVRLKGGDPFVFGRGGEEALALKKEGLEFEIVPGVSSAIAAPAYAGIPVTHRGISNAFAVVTGHEADTAKEGHPDWPTLAKIPTLIILMGLESAGSIVQALMLAGRDAETPCAAVEQGTTDQQRVFRTTLGSLPREIENKNFSPPVVIIIGEVVSLGHDLDWFNPGEILSMPAE
jgi:uroporphyrin-III C-methyltransferase